MLYEEHSIFGDGSKVLVNQEDRRIVWYIDEEGAMHLYSTLGDVYQRIIWDAAKEVIWL